LQTDTIDLYLAHRDDPATPLEETLEAFQRLIEQGKVRAVGASNYQCDRLREALDTAEAKSLPRFEVLQPFYNLYDRHDFEQHLKDVCERERLGVTPYFSLASGFLTGKYRSIEDAKGRPRQTMVDNYFDARGIRILGALDEVAERFSSSPATVALSWLMAQPAVTAPIASATSRHQLDQIIAATALQLDDDAIENLNSASAD
jgi:aryl-alcohol dehydrogenase-like predicted oxidoreductase